MVVCQIILLISEIITTAYLVKSECGVNMVDLVLLSESSGLPINSHLGCSGCIFQLIPVMDSVPFRPPIPFDLRVSSFHDN